MTASTFAYPSALQWTGRNVAAVRRRIDALETLLERAITLPGTRIPIGLNSIVGFVPVVGDMLAGAMGLYLVWEARNLGLSKWTIARMLGNVGIDTALGAVPLVGDVFDIMFRSNSRNLRLLKRHLDKHHPGTALVEARAL